MDAGRNTPEWQSPLREIFPRKTRIPWYSLPFAENQDYGAQTSDSANIRRDVAEKMA